MLIVYVDARLYACSAALDHVVTSPALRAAMFFFWGGLELVMFICTEQPL